MTKCLFYSRLKKLISASYSKLDLDWNLEWYFRVINDSLKCIQVALMYKLFKKNMHTNCFYQERSAIRSQAGASKSNANDETRPLIGVMAMPKNKGRPSLKLFWWKKRVTLPPFNGFLNRWKQPCKITICGSIKLTKLIIIQPACRLHKEHKIPI